MSDERDRTPDRPDDPLARLRRRAARREPLPPEPLPTEPLPPEPLPPVEVAEPDASPAEPVPVRAPEPAPVEVADVGDEPAVVSPTGRGGARRLSRAAVALVVLALLATGLSAVAAVATVRFAGGSAVSGSSPSGRAAILAAAVSGVTVTASYDYKTLDADERAAESQLAEPLKSAYAQRFRLQVAPLARKYHSTAKASVDPGFGAGVVSATGNHASVLLYVDQVVDNSQLARPRLDQTRVMATLTYLDGHWRVSGLRTL